MAKTKKIQKVEFTMKKLELALNEILKTGKGKSILLELDAESYLEINIKTIKIIL